MVLRPHNKAMNIFRLFFLALVAIPLLEIYLFIKVGGAIGVWQTVLVVLITAVIGAWAWRRQGLATLRRVQESMARNELPALPMLEGVLLMLAGALLITPGFFTDTLGFLLLIPLLRSRLASYMIFKGIFTSVQSRTHPDGKFSHRTLEGEYQRGSED